MKPATYGLPCGCINFVGREATMEMCPEHYKAWREVHIRWMQEDRAAHPIDDIEL